MRKIIVLFIFFFALFFVAYPKDALADDSITSAVKMQYSVGANGNTHVVTHFILTNTTPNLYVTSYTIKLGFDTISNVSASDPSGPVIPSVKSTQSGQEILIPFTTIAAGKGATLPFTLSFDTPNVASRNGSIWEVNIPGLQSQNNFTDFTVTLVVPDSFGKPTYVKPIDTNGLVFTKSQLERSGISLAFGQYQTYAYDVSYHLENKNVFPVRTDIALLPTTNYQNVSLDSLTPKPDIVSLDTDGNWIATYTLLPSQKMTVVADGLVSVSLTPQQSPLSQEDRKIFLKQQPYWQTNSQQVMQLAKDLKTPEAIYDYVVSHATYDFTRVKDNQTRVGALGVLQNPSSAVCLEFTDLFVALARAAGIPAREVDGFGYTQNTAARPLSIGTDVLHAWPEYYDDERQAWIMVDPTWGNTTGGVDYFHQLDFDHVAFVIKGVSSTTPIPAGGYKFVGQENIKDVAVTVTNQTITAQPSVTTDVNFPKTVLAGFATTLSLSLTNTGSVLFPSQAVQVHTTFQNPRDQQFILSPIPPFGKVRREIEFSKTPFLTNNADTITMLLGGKTLTAHVQIVPLTTLQFVIGGIICAILIAIIFIFATRSRRLPISKR